ncbi:unnamed protein product, partial [Brassica oleracea]
LICITLWCYIYVLYVYLNYLHSFNSCVSRLIWTRLAQLTQTFNIVKMLHKRPCYIVHSKVNT